MPPRSNPVIASRRRFLLPLVLGALLIIGFMMLTAIKSSQSDPQNHLMKHESTYNRVMRTKILRCGYVPAAPAVSQDQNGAFSGIFYDYMQEVGKILGIKVEFVQQLNMAEYADALQTHTIDVMCSGVTIAPALQNKIIGVTPIYSLPLFLFAKTGDHRFDRNIMAANNPAYTIVTIEGTVLEAARQKIFPRASVLELPQLARMREVFLGLASGEGDFILGDKYNYNEFAKANADRVTMVSAKPVLILPRSLALDSDDTELRDKLNIVTEQLQQSDVIRNLVERYQKYPGALALSISKNAEF